MSRMRGFSLVELSIVLVILGLLTGGILSGQSLIRAAEVRSLNMQYQQFVTAIQTFRDKYRALPGDMRNATSFWGKNATACNGDTGTASATGTCNGDGNGALQAAADTDYSVSREEVQVWNHLAQAGLIEGTYTGITHADGNFDKPKSKLNANSGGWRLRWYGDLRGTVTGTTVTTFALDYGNVLEVAAYNTVFLVPEEAWNVDTKMDDGKPAQGRLIGRSWANCSNATVRTEIAADYALANSAGNCGSMLFRNF